MLEESVVYQDILHKGEQRGFARGKQEGIEEGAQQAWRTIAVRQLEQHFGKLPPGVRRQLERMAVAQLEELCEILPGFRTPKDMLAWFKQHAAKN